MLDKILKYKEMLLYILFGGLTTLVNILSYALFTRVMGLGPMVSMTAAWVAAVLFAYITNRIWVFQSSATGSALIREIAYFFGARLVSYFLEYGFMFLFVVVLQFNDMIIKVVSNVFVVICNYIFSKFIIFKAKS